MRTQYYAELEKPTWGGECKVTIMMERGTPEVTCYTNETLARQKLMREGFVLRATPVYSKEIWVKEHK